MTRPNDLFWEQAHLEDSDEHPLARELAHRMDALHRYHGMITDAEAGGRDDVAELLTRQLAREEEECRRLIAAFERLRGGDGAGGAQEDGRKASGASV